MDGVKVEIGTGFPFTFERKRDGFLHILHQFVESPALREGSAELLKQLKVGGIMVIPVGKEENDEYIMKRITKKSDTEVEEETFGNFSFVPMLEKVQGAKNKFL